MKIKRLLRGSAWRVRSTLVIVVAASTLAIVSGEDITSAPDSVVETESPTTAAGGVDAANEDVEGKEFFERHIRPILTRRCYECHSHDAGKAKGGLVLDSREGWETGGSEGAAVVPGKPEESLLIQAIRYESYEMPPEEPLPKEEIALLEKWVEMGAPDPRETKVKKIDSKKLWALRPIAEPAVPTVRNTSWPRDEIDAFILARLEDRGLEPAPDADRYYLLRRVTFDLTGLPPTLDEIEAFIDDRSADAYEKVVDRLLASTAFGDHWARHWFDLSCYADLADIQGNVLVRDAWRYRDYVIAAFNSDKPLDRFIHEQLAGDLLPYETVAQQREQLIATGYLAIGPWTLQNYIKGQLDADVVDHQIDRIGRTFLGQTISCARCHDHKFDPIPTRDYYALAGIFHNTRTTSYDGPGVWSQITHVELPVPDATRDELAKLKNQLDNLNARRQTLQAELTSLFLKIPGATTANVLTLKAGIAANEKDREYEVAFDAAPSVWVGAQQRTTAADGLRIDFLRKDGSVLAGFLHRPGPWSGTKDAQTLHAAKFTYRGDGSGDVLIRITSSNPGSGRFGGALDNLTILLPGQTIFAENFDDLQPSATQGLQTDTALKVLAGVVVPRWNGAGINHSHAVDLGDGNYAVQFYSGSAGSLASAMPVTNEEKESHARAQEVERDLQTLDSELTALEKKFAPEKALGVRDVDSPADSPIYRRGAFQNHGDIVPRGFLSAVTTGVPHPVPAEESGRLQLAHWLTDPGNPLTSRVLVNRIWHHLFGNGLVRTVDYFGVHGETPSHPELLDYLALRMRDQDQWSLKSTVRRMVLSHTYQMASKYNAKAVEIDPENRLLWHMPRRRLTAESIRDAMLAASGELNPARGGPSLGLELEGNIQGGDNVNPAVWGGKIPADVKNRRSVYLPLMRERPQGELEVLSTFDFPHPSEIVGARPETTVATQALFLLNAPFVKQQAVKLADRLAHDASVDDRVRVNRLYLLTVSRPAEADEIETALGFLDQCMQQLASKSSPDEARRAAWVQLCHAMLGSNSFLFRE